MKIRLLKNVRHNGHVLTLLSLMVLVALIMLILNPGSYFTSRNLRSMLYQFPEYGILAFGMMLAMAAGGIDLSLVGIMNLSGVTAALLLTKVFPSETAGSAVAILSAVIAALLVGALCGALNGFVIGYFRLPAMLVTLCTLQLFTGLVYGLTGGPAINGMSSAFTSIANGVIPGTRLPWVLPIFLLVMAAVLWFSKCTVPGHEIYSLGSGPKAAAFSGIHTLRTTVTTYLVSGILGGISGILITSHLNSAKSTNGSSYTLLSILIVVLGGVDPNGGKGSVGGVTLAVILMQMISNAFTIMHVSQDAKNFANGALLVLTLLVTQLIRRRAEKKA